MFKNLHFNKEMINTVKMDMEKFYDKDILEIDIKRLQKKYAELPRVPLLLFLHYLYVYHPQMNIKQFDRFLYEIIGLHIEELLGKIPMHHPARELIAENHRFRQWLYRLEEGIKGLDTGWETY